MNASIQALRGDAGTISPAQFFSPENVGAIMAAAAPLPGHAESHPPA